MRLFTAIILITVFVASSADAAMEERDFLRLNPYSNAYLACEELADEVAPITLDKEHPDWTRVFRSCVEATLEIEPAAGVVSNPDFLNTGNGPDPSMEFALDPALDDFDPATLSVEAYQAYENQLLEQDSSGLFPDE